MKDRLTAYAFRLLARRAMTVREMERKLAGRAAADEVARVLADLEKSGYLDDEAWARAYAEQRLAARPCGPLLLRRKLLEKGVPPGIAARVVAETAAPVEEELAARLARARAAGLRGLPGEVRRRRVYTFLVGRGFSPSVARRLSGAGEFEPG